ncbi:hypothetical protein SEVIR_5G006650v4 [Setaria viridis]|uniref:Exportin-1 C-terminal domain-containing protein n=1 Tax=Setaria viridis TaxID=4556 RepID=A0A4U6U8G8_SETVI|nr:hypothetical protein SEVIR_5G006650v2 [Setaria viridis]
MMEYKNDPTNHWKEAIAAIYVAISVVGDLGTNAGFLCDIELMLDYTSCRSQKILKSTVLWFLKEFNDQIPKQNAQVLLQKAVKFLAHESHVVRSYAAVFTDKQLMMKDTVQAPGVNQVASSQRYDANSIDLIAAEVISNLLKLPDLYDNPYLTKCMAQVLGIANIAGQTIRDTTALLAGILNQVCNNSKNPEFNGYLFEALAAVIGRANEQGPAPLCVFEGMLLPVLFRILSEDISDLLPYGFMIFSQLIDLCQPPLSHEYMNLFDLLLSSATWEQPACAHACSCLLRAFLCKIKNDHDKLKIVLQKFCTLVLNVSTTYTAFAMLSLLVEQAGLDFLRLHISDTWGVLFPRLWVLRQSRWEVKFAKSLIVAVSLFVTKYGSQEFVESIQEIDRRAERYFTTFLEHFWIRYLDSIEGARESKLAAVASTKLICETNFLKEDPHSWGKLLNSTVPLL